MHGNPEVAKRVKAARAFAGYTSVPQLAAAIDQRGLSTKTLRAIEQARRIAEPRELTAIAEACGLSIEFFRMDFTADLGQERYDDDLRTRVRNVESQAANLVALLNRSSGRFSRIEEELREVRSQVDRLTQESLARREREAAEQERQNRDTTRGTAGAEDGH